MGERQQSDLAFTCDCGSLQGHITADDVARGTHVVCYCADCRAGQLYLGQPDPAPDPVEILQIAQEAIRIDKGAENLAVMQLSPNGMLRWYAKCCNAPLATTMHTLKIPFAGFIVNRFSETSQLPPVTTRGFVPRPDGGYKHQKPLPAMFGLLRRAIRSRLTGRWKQTPLFDVNTGKPIVEPSILTKDERSALYR